MHCTVDVVSTVVVVWWVGVTASRHDTLDRTPHVLWYCFYTPVGPAFNFLRPSERVSMRAYNRHRRNRAVVRYTNARGTGEMGPGFVYYPTYGSFDVLAMGLLTTRFFFRSPSIPFNVTIFQIRILCESPCHRHSNQKEEQSVAVTAVPTKHRRSEVLCMTFETGNACATSAAVSPRSHPRIRGTNVPT